MERREITETLTRVLQAQNEGERNGILLLGIYHLLYAIADEMGVISDENED